MADHQVFTYSTNYNTERRHCEMIRHESDDSSSSNQDNVPLQVYKTRPLQKQQTKDTVEEENNDDICIGTILQRSATTTNRRPTGQPITRLTQSRSLRSTSGRTPRDDPPPLPSQDDEELRVAMQRAWAVLDNGNERLTATNTTPGTVSTAPVTESDKSNMNSNGRIQTVPFKTLTTRIYIDDAKNHKVVQLNSLLTTAMVVQYLKKKGLLDNSDDWTLFEIANSHGVERPLREWEIVLDIVSVWDSDAGNALLVKKYSYHYTLTSESVLHRKIPPMHGWLSIEYKKGKWQKRYCFVKDNAIHHAKDNNKGSSTSILCHLATYDVYTMLPPLKPSPTPYVFAIRAQERASMFEREGDYMRCLAVEDQDEMKNWVLSIRCTKSGIQYQHYPNRIVNPLAPISFDTPTSEESNIRRHKSTKEFNTNNKSSEDHAKHVTPSLPKSESTRKVAVDEKKPLARHGTTRGSHRTTPATTLITIDNPPADVQPVADEGPTFAKGSLLAKEEQIEQILYRQQQQQQYEESQQTLIQINDRIQFSKGSLLDQKENRNIATAPANKMTRSKSVREVSSSNRETNEEASPSSRRHVSLRRKPTNKKPQHHDVPLPNTTPITTNTTTAPLLPPPPPYSQQVPPSNNSKNTTLLQLNDTPERFHSRELHGRHVKPLLNFDSDERPATTRK
ncbi:unnamed protein product [Mucor hiemalis]